MLKDKFSYIEEVQPPAGNGWFLVPAEKLLEVVKHLRDEEKFDVLSCLTGTDKGSGLEVVYHLFSTERRETVVLKVSTVLAVPTVSSLFESADWMERETFDLLGINFTGHANLKRILLPDDWAGYPLKKDYVEGAEYLGMTTTR